MHMINKLFRLNFLTAALCLWAAGSFAASDLSQLNVFPNPVRKYAGDTVLNFDNLSNEARLRLYTASGSLVREVHFSGITSRYSWDLRNDAGEEVVSGVYVYIVTNGSGEKKSGKVIVIR